MSGWAPKRFWTDAVAEPCEGGFGVRLDARPVRTPLKAPMVLPTLAMAQAIAAEWQAQTGAVNPATMPCTRAANSAIDNVARQFDAVVAMLAA
ncbi:MAG: ATP12 family chaperone protein, partial [Tabrizicola sp.]|nr:ATP12 family chaperone protein [Tabrizicola sp.]